MEHDSESDLHFIPAIKDRLETNISGEKELFQLNRVIEEYLVGGNNFFELNHKIDSINTPELKRFVSNLQNYYKKLNQAEVDSKLSASLHSITNHTRNQYHLLSEMFPYAVARVEFPSGKILHVNSKCKELLSCMDTGLCSKTFIDRFVFEEDKSSFINELEAAGRIINFESEFAKQDGTFFLASITASRLHTSHTDEILVYLIDVDEQKKTEEERERLLEELALSKMQIEEEAGNYVQVNLQLAESEEKLQEMNATKDKYFSIIGHDLKNPLFVIRSMSEILETEYEEISNEDRISFIKAIRESSNSAFALLEDLLHWARCQSGVIEFNPEPLGLQSLVTELFSLVEAQALKKQIVLLSHIKANHIIDADKFMISTILRNLVSNAIKFTDVGGRIMITSKEDDHMVEISVIDSGIGLSQTDICKLFRIDIKNHEIGKSKEKGTGLGLILCKEFAEKHGGQIWVESEIGKGSKFKFTVPKVL